MAEEKKHNTANGSDDYTRPTELQKWCGVALITLGVIGFAIALLIPKNAESIDSGEVVAVSMLFIMLGLAFFLPQLLAVSNGQDYSTMRVVVFIIVAVFVITAVKIGWNAETFDDFTIDRSWLYILGLAFGSKVFQSFAEEKEEN